MHWKCQHISFKNIPKISQDNSISENNFGPFYFSMSKLEIDFNKINKVFFLSQPSLKYF